MTETDQPQPIRRGRGRRPAAEVREQVLAAAGELLLTEGMAGFTIEKVAARAGASRMTIYKWWPSRGALALDGYATKVRTVLEFPDLETATTWYASPEYGEARATRAGSATARFVAVEGLE